MRRWVWAWPVLAGSLLTGCGPRFFQLSLNPFFADGTATVDVGGRWIAEGDEPFGLVFRPTGQHSWAVGLLDCAPDADPATALEESGAVVSLGELDGQLYWDMTVEDTHALGDLAQEHLLGLHSVARLRLEGDSMEVAYLDPDWLRKALADGRVELEHFLEGGQEDGSTILTASTADLESFLQEYGDDAEAFGETQVFHRVE
jgi:hypothetical protein